MTATFIAPSLPPETDAVSYLRRDFTVTEAVRSATLRVTAIGVIEPRLNGRVVGDEVLTPGWTSYRHRLAVSVHDVTDQILQGANTLGALLGEGWAVGRLGYEGKRHHYAARPGAYLDLTITYADRTEHIVSDEHFRASEGALQTSSLYDGEAYDARLEQTGWDTPGFDDSAWSTVALIDWPEETLFDATAEPIRRIESLAPLATLRTPSGRTVLDFGQNISGRVRFTVDGEKGTTVTLRHAEVLVNGEPDYETLRTAKATDHYTLQGDGAETWEPRFTFHGFRYVEIDGWPGEVDPDAFQAIVTHSDMRRTGWLETSNPLLNQLHSNAVWSMRDNFVGVPTDCPQRDERLGWTGDLNSFAPTAVFLYDVRGVLGSWLADLAVEQHETGSVPWVVPNILETQSPPTALWSDTAVNLPWTLYQEYGDVSILRDAYDSMTAHVRQVAGLLDEDSLWSRGFQFGDWLDPDAPMDAPADGKTNPHLVAAAYLCRTTRRMAAAARALDETTDADEFSALAERVRAAFRAEFITPKGRIVNETATAYALAITLGILDDVEKVTAGEQLAAVVSKADYRITSGFAGTPLVAEALSSTGHLAEAYLMLLETEFPSFLYPITQGATTIWERWDAIQPDGTINPSGMTSLNHYALGSVVDWMHRTIGGLTALEPGYRTMRIAPQPGGGLTYANLLHHTVHGEIGVSWSLDGPQVTVEVTIPADTTATVELPLHPDALITTVTEGTHQWNYERRTDKAGPFSLDTPLAELAQDPDVWRRITRTFKKHMPRVPLDAGAPEAAGMSLGVLLSFIPDPPADLAPELTRQLAER